MLSDSAFIDLIDKRINKAFKESNFLVQKLATVISYNSTTKITTVKYPENTTNTDVYNASGQSLIAGDVVIIIKKNNSNYATGCIFGKYI